jgi:predicted DNA-binding protein
MERKKMTIVSKKYKGVSSVISTRVPIEIVHKVDEIADKTGRTRNEIVLMCLEFALENLEIKEEKGE